MIEELLFSWEEGEQEAIFPGKLVQNMDKIEMNYESDLHSSQPTWHLSGLESLLLPAQHIMMLEDKPYNPCF
jgi:hypothetical protein